MASLVIASLRPVGANVYLRQGALSVRQKSLLSYRSMATTVPQKFQFLVFAPDKTDEGAFQRRLAVRPEHLANAKMLEEKGVIS